ncbi:MAG: hypothetical protein OEX04_01095 [Acidimicrobiia bacterium]|nr:hypothetical protein [Acidimicrobiia bacterium]MDH4306049.1 hypothetical protein [Acidimicrobiia bacterium]
MMIKMRHNGFGKAGATRGLGAVCIAATSATGNGPTGGTGLVPAPRVRLTDAPLDPHRRPLIE